MLPGAGGGGAGGAGGVQTNVMGNDPAIPKMQQRKISVVLLPSQLTPQHQVEDSLVVCIQHRATVTVVTAMGAG